MNPSVRIMTDGLEDVVAAHTRLSHVDGEAGRLIIFGYAVEDLAPFARFEDVALHRAASGGKTRPATVRLCRSRESITRIASTGPSDV